VAVSIGFGFAFLRYERLHRTHLAEADSLKNAVAAEGARQSAVLANLSHEIRTPLNGIVGMAELLASDPEIIGESREHIAMLSRSTAALLALLNDVLDLAKLNAGKLQIHVEEVSIVALVRETVGLFAGVAVEK
jgi:signal transduction histidine kinase